MNWRSLVPRRRGTRDRSASSAQSSAQRGTPGGDVSLPGDNPIRDPKDDALGRAGAARSFSEEVLSLDASEGLVVGVLGAWGSGKTSFVNLARIHLESASAAVLDFNPWMFSGAHQLVESFFIELASQLRLHPRYEQIGRAIEDYGEAFSSLTWLPLVGPWIERARVGSKLFAKLLERRKQGVGGRREKLEEQLSSLQDPVIVVIDDIDRLTTPEIRDVFKLIRLTANFPNVIYLVAFDRERVEEALAEQGIPGRDYLEKILQLGLDLPAVPYDVLNREIFRALNATLEDLGSTGPFNQDAWPDAFMEIIRPLIRNMRDVRRYAAAVHGTVRDLGGRIELVDVLSLEAIRVFLPDVFREMSGSVDALTTTSSMGFGGRGDPPHLEAQVERLLEAAGNREGVVKAMIERLFPAAQRHVGGSHFGAEWQNRWLRERRVAHKELLRLYLERSIGEGLQAFTDAERAWDRLADADALDEFLRSVAAERREDVISSLEVYEDEFSTDHVVPTTTVLLNLLPDLPERDRGMFDPGAQAVVRRVVYRLLRTLQDEAAVESAVREILPRLATLTGKLQLINVVGHRQGRGHELVSESVAEELERAWRAEVREASVNRLVAEPDLLRCLLLAKRESDDTEDYMELPDTPELTAAVLAAAKTESRRQTLGSRVVQRSSRLFWDALVEVYGGEEILRERVQALRATELDGLDELLALVDKYLAGWRPSDFEDDS